MNVAELVPRLVVGRAVIEGQGVPREDATRLAVVPTLVEGPLVQSVVLAFVLGRNAAPAAPSQPVTPRPTVPNLIGKREEEATKEAEAAGFRIFVEGTEEGEAGVVVAQAPEPGTPSDPGDPLILTVGGGSTPPV